jgi:hypothetical protein
VRLLCGSSRPGANDGLPSCGPACCLAGGSNDGRSKRRSFRVLADDDVVVATLTYDRDDSEAEETARADAQLIAAAPDMYAVLREVLGKLERAELQPLAPNVELVSRIRTALERAEGRANA